EVGLRRRGRKSCARSAGLDVADGHRQLRHHRRADGLLFEGDTWPGGGGHAEVAAEGRADRRAHRGDLVLRLEGDEVEVLVAGKGGGEGGWRRYADDGETNPPPAAQTP